MSWRTHLACLAVVGAAACSDYHRRGPTSDAGDAGVVDAGVVDSGAVDARPPDTGGSSAYSCDRLCGRIRPLSGCSQTYNGCLGMCATETRGFPATCTARFEALFACIEATPVERITCTAMTYPYPDCMAINGSALDCARTAP